MEAERELSAIPKKEKSWASQKDLRSKPEKLRRGSKEREESSAGSSANHAALEPSDRASVEHAGQADALQC